MLSRYECDNGINLEGLVTEIMEWLRFCCLVIGAQWKFHSYEVGGAQQVRRGWQWRNISYSWFARGEAAHHEGVMPGITRKKKELRKERQEPQLLLISEARKAILAESGIWSLFCCLVPGLEYLKQWNASFRVRSLWQLGRSCELEIGAGLGGLHRKVMLVRKYFII